MDYQKVALKYKDELLDNVIPFWLAHSRDSKEGGYFSCLDNQGYVYDTDKFTWMQGREIWTFSMLCDRVGMNDEWLDMALHGAKFLQKNGRDAAGNFYFSLNRQGKPLIQPYNIFSDCFASMAFGALHKVHPDPGFAKIAKGTFQNILSRLDNPNGQYNKSYPGTRSLKGFALPMILSNLSIELEHILGAEMVQKLTHDLIHEVMEVFYRKEFGLILENVNSDGTFSDSFDGRLISPGHGIEAMWFMIDLAQRFDDKDLLQKAIKVTLQTLEFAWDEEYGGIYYFMDVKGYPPDKLEWNQKLWWVHCETLVCLAKAIQLTGNPDCKGWFEKVHDYTWSHFKDSEHEEWFGYLQRDGKVLLNLKGGKWKGCFHVPRALYQVWGTLDKIERI